MVQWLGISLVMLITVVGCGGNMISDQAEAQGVSAFLLLSHCSVWNSPVQSSFLPYHTTKSLSHFLSPHSSRNEFLDNTSKLCTYHCQTWYCVR